MSWIDLDNDPFFRDDFIDPEQHFKRVHQEMNNMMSSMFKAFNDFGIGFDDDARGKKSLPGPSDHTGRGSKRDPPSRRTPSYDDYTPSSSTHRSSKQPIIEEPDSDMPDYSSSSKVEKQKPHIYYSAMATSYNGVDGIQQTKKKVYDSQSGKTQYGEMRRIGDQALAYKREVGPDGKVSESEERKGIKTDQEATSFRSRWDSEASKKLPTFSDFSLGRSNALGDSSNSSSNYRRQRALK